MDRIREPVSRRFPHQPFRTIARDGPSNLFADDKRHARLLQAIRPRTQEDERVCPGTALLPYPLHVGFGLESPRALDTHLRIRPGLLGKFLGAFNADRKTQAPFGAPRFQDLAPAFALHFFAKAVNAQAVQTLGLIDSFQSRDSSIPETRLNRIKNRAEQPHASLQLYPTITK